MGGRSDKRPYGNRWICAPKTTYALLGRLYPGISRLCADFNPTLLWFLEPLQKVEVTCRNGFPRRLSIGRAKLLPRLLFERSGVGRLVRFARNALWGQCLKPNISSQPAPFRFKISLNGCLGHVPMAGDTNINWPAIPIHVPKIDRPVRSPVN
jgi:hypothetical protein